MLFYTFLPAASPYLLGLSECHSKPFRYPVIKSWFLAKYPEIATFGILEIAQVVEQGKATQVASISPEQSKEAA